MRAKRWKRTYSAEYTVIHQLMIHQLMTLHSNLIHSNFKIKYKFKNRNFCDITYVVNIYESPSLCQSNFRIFKYLLVEKFPKHRCISGLWQGLVPILNVIFCGQNSSNPHQILTVDREYVYLLRKICFIK